MKNTMGLGYRAPFFQDLESGYPEIGWLEVITENYLWDRGVRRQTLESLRKNYDIAFHGVSLSIASPDGLDQDYLTALRDLIQELEPIRVSDHLCWSALKNHHWNDLLPFPYTKKNLQYVCQKVSEVQDFIQRPLSLENLSAYIQSGHSEMSEYDFLAEVSKKTGCEILLDLNNMIVNQKNFSTDPMKELDKLDLSRVSQVHLAGYTDKGSFVIDTHSKEPDESTWKLWEKVCQKRSDIPFMIEWDSDIPPFEDVTLLLRKAQDLQRGPA